MEYCVPAEGIVKMWCVFRREEILARHERIDDALADARRIARADKCRVWLVGGEGLIPIDLDGPPVVGE